MWKTGGESLPLQYSSVVGSLRHVSFHPDQICPPYLVGAELETLYPAQSVATLSNQDFKDSPQLSSQTESVSVSLWSEPRYDSPKNVDAQMSHRTSCVSDVLHAEGKPARASESVSESQTWKPAWSRLPIISFGPLIQASREDKKPFLLSVAYVGISPRGLTISRMAFETRL